MTQHLKNKTVLVTGASSGIGKSIAVEIAREGGNLVLLARNEGKLKELTNHLQDEWRIAVSYYRCDVSNREDVHHVFQRMKEEGVRIDALINNAGFGVFEDVMETDLTSFQSMFDVNVLGLIQCVKEVLPSMLSRGTGHIVNIASQAGKISTPKSSGYAATKHAVLGFTNSLRLEVQHKGVYVTAVNLGPVRTNFFDTADPDGTYTQSVERWMLDPDRVARTVVRHLFKRKREINLPTWMELGSKVYQLMPGVVEAMFAKQFRKK
ncbi:oxidoreductase [Pontibacillus halophilus JSM 076056 = DSM 19796]|uniref:Oxidoreductase n=1 Tax=Pontibacillus halophilus JSM 076056 = DSM 19796 TaxID=1385510 RepID=A0A0A5GDS7_9BACI|nr:SDR family oxidoreductase [Pontibacillus halophilus]KGX91366.1 oxidoreductase [Pontibacillus halophilus JSM 076056 = DSM 19796]